MFAQLLIYLQPGLAAVSRFYIPFLLVQLTSVLIVFSYYYFPDFQSACVQLAAWKKSGGLIFIALATIFAGGILPEIAKALTGKLDLHDGTKAYFRHLFWVCLMYCCSGILVERFFWLQNHLFGADITPSSVMIKVFVDQFIFSPLLALPYAVVYFLWLEEDCDLRRTWERLTPRLMIERSLPLIFPNWVYWIPMNFCMYSLPLDLQFPLFLTGLAAWSLIFVNIVQQPARAAQTLKKSQVSS